MFFILTYAHAQEQDSDIKHADPVYEDLTIELGAEKGENELNINFVKKPETRWLSFFPVGL